jgi:hypothetical protein
MGNQVSNPFFGLVCSLILSSVLEIANQSTLEAVKLKLSKSLMSKLAFFLSISHSPATLFQRIQGPLQRVQILGP